jgi:FAD/FMN-containing dehydrogenase
MREHAELSSSGHGSRAHAGPRWARRAAALIERSARSLGRGMARVASRVRRTAHTWAMNTLYTAVYVATGGRRTVHEGRYLPWRSTWTNWSRTFEAQPHRFETPATEADICRVVREAGKLRVVGSGHSFNTSPLTGGTMLSLDRYNQVLSIDAERRVVRVQAGIRLRDLTRRLVEVGLAFPVLGSTDAQSIAGLIATDLHGTGRDHGFLSEQILSLRIVDAFGVARTHRRGSDVFHAAIGAIGTCGVVIEVEIQCVPAYNLAKSLRMVDRHWVRENIDGILAGHDHVSFYYIAGVDTKSVRMNLWNRTEQSPGSALGLRRMMHELIDMAVSGYLLGLSKLLDVADVFASLGAMFFQATMDGRITVYPSAMGFARKLYYHHDEIEYGVPYERHRECLDEVLALLRERRFVTIVEVRFTPDTSGALIGPGAGRRTCFIELAPSLSVESAEIFAEVETIFAKYGGRPHLGKKTGATRATMAEVYRERWARFCEVRRRQDPAEKFLNDFGALFQPEPASEAEEPASTSAAA